MVELPDVTIYVECLERRIGGRRLSGPRIASPFLLRTFDPPILAAHGKRVIGVERLGKRVVIELEGELFLVFHLMIAGRFRWREPGAKIPGKIGLGAFDFESGTLVMTEAGAKKRASLHVVRGRHALTEHDPGGLEVLDSTAEAFAVRLRQQNHTLKRALTSPRLFSGIGNAYSDEILWHARLSPLTWTSRLGDAEVERLHASTIATPRTKPTTAPRARPTVRFLPTAYCRSCSRKTGRARWKSGSRSVAILEMSGLLAPCSAHTLVRPIRFLQRPARVPENSA